ncbi:hypothetical protein JKP88DRAFT_349507 [Tribonema minus]|uniref:Uncharacterized protein n=1 Tax=Tribonema minus TaxID=303371 RepID=A0A835Z1A0_9STRA|nr:hypothetical protein JKP88DRAFT_349507 [Tribonema minus]
MERRRAAACGGAAGGSCGVPDARSSMCTGFTRSVGGQARKLAFKSTANGPRGLLNTSHRVRAPVIGAAAGGAGWQLVSEFCAAQDASARALAKQLLGARLPPIGRALVSGSGPVQLVLAKAGWSGTDAGLLVGYHAGLLPLAVAATIAGQLACLAVTYALLRTLLAGGAEVRRDPAALRAPSAAPPSLREVADWAAFNATRSAVDRVAAQRNATLAFGGAGGAHPGVGGHAAQPLAARDLGVSLLTALYRKPPALAPAAAAAATAAAMRIDALAEVRGFDLSSTSGQLLAQAVVEGMARGGGADGGGGYGETARPLTALLDARMLAELREMEGTRVGGYTLVSTRGGRDPAVTRMAAAAALAGPRWALLAAVLLRVRPAAAATGVASGIALSAMAVASLVTAGQAHAAVLYCVVRDCVGSPARALLQVRGVRRVEWLMRLLVGKYLLLELQRTFKRSLQRSRARRLQLQHQRQQLQQQYEDQEQQQR